MNFVVGNATTNVRFVPDFSIPKKKWTKAPEFVKYGNENEGDGRAYIVPFTGESYPSVTTITRLETGNFSRYNVEKAVEWCVDNWSQLGVDPVVAKARGMASGLVHRDERAWVGSQVHQYVQSLREGSWDFPVLEDYEQVDMVSEFQSWWGTSGRVPLFTELTVVNETYGYAGTLDGIDSVPNVFTGELDTVLFDMKTSRTAGYPGHWMQLAALAHGEYGMRPVEKGTVGAVEYVNGGKKRWAVKVDLPVFDRVEIIHVRDDGLAVLTISAGELSSFFEEFLAYRKIWEIRQGRKGKE